MNYKYTLSSKVAKVDCPSCRQKKRFVLYVDNETNMPLHSTVGKCDRDSNCGYHYTPKQYFIDNGIGINKPKYTTYTKAPEPVRPMGTLPMDLVSKSQSIESNFGHFLIDLFKYNSKIVHLCQLYKIGATRAKEVIFWQIDLNGKVRTGKIMQYDPTTGKRSKTQPTDWIHSRMIKAKQLPADYNLKQCFFGEHLLTDTTKIVAIVEAEKTAIIASGLLPDFIWIAAGQLHGLNIEKCKCLTGRNVVLFPDLSEKKENRMTAYEVWSAKAIEIMKAYQCKVIVSDLLERKATDSDRQNGLDVADYLIQEQGKPPAAAAASAASATPKPAASAAAASAASATPKPAASAATPTPTPATPKPAASASAATPTPATPKPALYKIGMQLIGKQNNLNINNLTEKLIEQFDYTDTLAKDMINQLTESNIIQFLPNVERFCMTDSTPF